MGFTTRVYTVIDLINLIKREQSDTLVFRLRYSVYAIQLLCPPLGNAWK